MSEGPAPIAPAPAAPGDGVVSHLLLTRFNLRAGGVYDDRYSDAWMAHRMTIFARWCLPSVRAQAGAAFRWLVFFDRTRSEPWRAEIDRLAALAPFEPVFLDDAAGLVAAIAARAPSAGVVVTSRLDNDDVLHRDHLALVRRAAEAVLAAGDALPAVIDVRTLLWWDVAGGSLRVIPHREVSPYASLVERVAPGAPARTVFAAPHNRLDRAFGPPRMIDGRVLTLVHDRNVANGLRRNHALARLWLRLRHGQRFLVGADAARLLAEFGVAGGVRA